MDGKRLNVGKGKRISARAQRILKKRAPQIVEHTKKCLILKGHKTSEVICDVLQDLSKLLKPSCVSFNRKNEILPFEDANSIEFLTEKNDCSLFALGSHIKKRPNNLVLGRTFDGHILDMIEFGVDSYESIDSFAGSKKAVGSKPMLAFLGSQWESDSTYGRIRNYFIDLFRGVAFDLLSLQSVDHVLVFTVIDSKIHFRGYFVSLRKSGTKVHIYCLIHPILTSNDVCIFIDTRRKAVADGTSYGLVCAPHTARLGRHVESCAETAQKVRISPIVSYLYSVIYMCCCCCCCCWITAFLTPYIVFAVRRKPKLRTYHARHSGRRSVVFT